MSINTKKLSRREREKLAHEAEIIAAAERVFVSKGFDHATIEEIAKEAEFSVGAIYNFFNGKDDLREKVITKIIEEFLTVFQENILSEQNSMAALDALVDLRVSHVEEHGAFFRLVIESQVGASMNPENVLPHRCRGMYDNYIQDVASIFKKAISTGFVRKMDPIYAALSLEGVINAFTAYWTRTGNPESVETRIRHVRQNYLHMILKEKKQERGKRQ